MDELIHTTDRARRGEAGRVKARRVMAGRHGMDGLIYDITRRGGARLGSAGRGSAGCGLARCGLAWRQGLDGLIH